MMRAAKKALDRRSFLRAMPAAPLAAPSIAAEIAKGPGMLGNSLSAGYPSDLPSTSPATDVDWVAERTKKLQAAARGDFGEEEEAYLKPNWQSTSAYHYDSLRSLSPVMRSRFHAEHMVRKQREEKKFWASFELKRFLKDNARRFF